MSNAEILTQESSELRKLDLVKNQIKAELSSLQTEAFYNKNEQTGKIDYNLSTVKSYLETVKEQDRKKLISKNSSAFMMAVQIALESQGYDVGKIDGLRGKATMLQVQSFQKAQGLKADGLPRPATIKGLLEQRGRQAAQTPAPAQAPDTLQPEPQLSPLNKLRIKDVGSWRGESFVIKAGLEQQDKQGTYINVAGQKYYKDVKEGLGYKVNKNND